MKKYFLILPVIMLLAAGCGSGQPSANNNMDAQPPADHTPVTTSSQTNQMVPTRPGGNANTSTSSQVPSVKSGYTFAQVAAANSSEKCWSIVGQNVYDLTSWIDRHPGGAKAILNICGKDGTSAFIRQHGGQAKAEAALAQFKIGPLSN